MHWCIRMTTRTEYTNRDGRKGRGISSAGADDAVAERDRKRVEALEYVRSMLGELNEIARRERFDMVAYLVEMACVEAADILAREATPRRRKAGRA